MSKVEKKCKDFCATIWRWLVVFVSHWIKFVTLTASGATEELTRHDFALQLSSWDRPSDCSNISISTLLTIWERCDILWRLSSHYQIFGDAAIHIINMSPVWRKLSTYIFKSCEFDAVSYSFAENSTFVNNKALAPFSTFIFFLYLLKHVIF